MNHDNNNSKNRKRMAWIAAVVAVLALVPAVAGSFTVSLLNDIGIGALVALGLVLLTGIGGATSFGQAAFVGIAAYASAWLTTAHGASPWLGLVFALVLTGLAALAIGTVCHDAPRLGDRVDPAFDAVAGTERRAVVVVAAPVPLTVPGAFERLRQPLRIARVAVCAAVVVSTAAEWYEVAEDVVKEEAQPRAFPSPFRPDAVHAVVPITAADER